MENYKTKKKHIFMKPANELITIKAQSVQNEEYKKMMAK